jgi:hypothetical protein
MFSRVFQSAILKKENSLAACISHQRFLVRVMLLIVFPVRLVEDSSFHSYVYFFFAGYQIIQYILPD